MSNFRSKIKMKWIYAILGIIIISGMVTGSIFLYFYLHPGHGMVTPEKKNFYWYVPWNNDSKNALFEHPNDINMISPEWLVVGPNGTIINSSDDSFDPQIIHFCSNHNISIIPLVSNYDTEFNATLVHNLISNNSCEANFLNSLNALLLSSYNISGINLDFENVPAGDRTLLNNFIEYLKENIPQDKLLTIDVPGKQIDSLVGWSGTFDYNFLGKYCDMVMIMTYDYSYSTSASGPIAPFSWVNNVMRFALQTIPNTKIYGGIPLYGYDWNLNSSSATGNGYNYFNNLTQKLGIMPSRDTGSGELYFNYKDSSGYSHTCYYCDLNTTIMKRENLSTFPIGGYCYWYLGVGPSFT